jgi:aminoglycoside phosphotransferase (APT) family kinase protein
LIYRLLVRDPVVATLVPTVLDDGNGQLVLEAIPGIDLQARRAAGGDIEPSLARAVGQALARVHASQAVLRDAPPVVESLARGSHAPDLAFVRRLSGAGIELLRMMQRSDELRRRLEHAAEGERDSLVHGDLRWENIMVGGGAGDPPRVWLVDWEFAGRGDARDDVGAFVAACIGVWIDSAPAVPGVPLERLIDAARWPAPSMRRAIREFTNFYGACRGMDPSTAAGFVAGAFRAAAVRLVHLAFEATRDRETLGLGAVLHLQIALNILRDPGAAARAFCDAPTGNTVERAR